MQIAKEQSAQRLHLKLFMKITGKNLRNRFGILHIKLAKTGVVVVYVPT